LAEVLLRVVQERCLGQAQSTQVYMPRVRGQPGRCEVKECLWCGNEFEQSTHWGAAKKKYCGLGCKQAASRYREREAEGGIRYLVRQRVYSLMRSENQSRFSKFVGCTTAFLRAHLEKQFVRGMNWENYGAAWELDHVVPLSAWNLNNPNELARAEHWSNIRPVWREHNWAKNSSIIPCQPEMPLALL